MASSIIAIGVAMITLCSVIYKNSKLEELKNCFTISDKARCIAGSVLELVCAAGG